MKLVTNKFKSGGLHEKHVVATWNLGNHSAFASRNRETKKNLCRSGRMHDVPNTDFWPAVRYLKAVRHLRQPGIYRIIRKSVRDFRPLRYSSWVGHAEGEHVNRGRDTPSFCLTIQVLDMSTLGDAVDVNPVIKLLPHTLQHQAVDSSDYLHDPLLQLW